MKLSGICFQGNGDAVPTKTKNSERYYVYGALWKSPEEVRFYLDGKYVYSINPKVAWDVPAFIQMAVEIYDWNPVPEDGGLVETGTWEQRTTQYDWVRTWELTDEAVASKDASPEDATLHFKPADHVLGDVHPFFHEGECRLTVRSDGTGASVRAARISALKWADP